MKSIYIVFIITLVLPMSNEAQNLVEKDKNGNLLLLGKSTRERLQQAPFDNWFNQEYNQYVVDSATANQLKNLLKGKRLQIFMGTWCGDSRREVPRLYKLLDYCGIAQSEIELVNVDYRDSAYKKSPTHEEKGLQIIKVPDLLIYEKEKELGRVVESPVTSWEKDLLAILKGEPYIHKYKGTQ